MKSLIVIMAFLYPVAASADSITGLAPQSFYAGSAEEFITINGTGLSGSDYTTVLFDGPAGAFTIAPNNVSDTVLAVFVPTQVFTASGSYAVTVFAHDVNAATRQIGPATLSIVNWPASNVPLLALPEVVTAEATSAAGAVVSFSVGATNPDGTSAAVTCDHSSGATYPLDTTAVHCTAGSASGVFLIVVTDTVAPTLSLPANITSSNPLVNYSATANDAIDGAVVPVCTPASGSIFALGDTFVVCTATDARANQATGTLRVTIVCPTTSSTLTVSERYFSPNGDGQKDVTTAALHVSTGDIPWTMNVRNAAGAVVRSWSGSGSCVAATWDGKDAGSVVQP